MSNCFSHLFFSHHHSWSKRFNGLRTSAPLKCVQDVSATNSTLWNRCGQEKELTWSTSSDPWPPNFVHIFLPSASFTTIKCLPSLWYTSHNISHNIYLCTYSFLVLIILPLAILTLPSFLLPSMAIKYQPISQPHFLSRVIFTLSAFSQKVVHAFDVLAKSSSSTFFMGFLSPLCLFHWILAISFIHSFVSP